MMSQCQMSRHKNANLRFVTKKIKYFQFLYNIFDMKFLNEESIFLLKKIIYLVSILSRTRFYFIFIFFAVMGFYSKAQQHFPVFSGFSTFLVTFLMTSSFLLCILLNIKVSFALLEKWLGFPFLNHHFPITFLGYRGIYPFAIFLFTLFVIFSIETTSQFVNQFETESIKEIKQREGLEEILRRVKNCEESLKNQKDDDSFEKIVEKIIKDPKISNLLQPTHGIIKK